MSSYIFEEQPHLILASAFIQCNVWGKLFSSGFEQLNSCHNRLNLHPMGRDFSRIIKGNKFFNEGISQLFILEGSDHLTFLENPE